jgi:hypothetical protein
MQEPTASAWRIVRDRRRAHRLPDRHRRVERNPKRRRRFLFIEEDHVRVVQPHGVACASERTCHGRYPEQAADRRAGWSLDHPYSARTNGELAQFRLNVTPVIGNVSVPLVEQISTPYSSCVGTSV